MESPVVLDKPTDYHGSKGDERGFPFDEEESSGAWSSLAARHPDIAARLRQRPATWARKRRPSSQDPTDDFGDSFGGFDRFPFDDIPPEFREHFPSHWARRFEEAPPAPAPPAPAPAPASPQQSSAGTQTEPPAPPAHEPLPQYGLRNTVDLGQRSAADPSVDAESRAPRSMSAPPAASMSAPPEPDHHATVRHIPIFVEGRDEPVLSRDKPEPRPPPPPHVDRDQYFADDGPATFHHPPNFSRAFGTPFNKGFRQGPQPFVQQKVYPQTAFTRGASPQRSQSPKPQSPKPQAQPEEHFAKPEPPARAQPPPAASPPPPKPQPSPNDPITLILSIQTDVLNLMSEVENFMGTKKDKKYMFLDEMLTRNLIKLDNIETEGKENIRLARKEAIKCIQKCIAVLEAKAESNAAQAAGRPAAAAGEATEETKEEAKAATQEVKDTQDKNEEQKPEEPKVEAKPEEIKQETQPQAADTRPENTETRAVLVEKPEETTEDVDKASPKKNKKVVKKRDKSKDNKDSTKEADCKEKKVENMQVDDKGDKSESQTMEVDGAAASQ